jgi:cellulose synthase/poly-beta-1,6-N-acetylglucosamine synthase-like glycosyltransferase
MAKTAKTWSTEIKKVILTHTLLVGIPAIFYICLILKGWSLVTPRAIISSLFLFSALMIIVETSSALFRRFATNQADQPLPPGRSLNRVKAWMGLKGSDYPQPTEPVPACSFLVAAYLPNEQDIIVETIQHLLFQVKRPPGGLEIILAYNTPVDLLVEAELRKLAKQYPELKLLRVEGSQSKAENINAALDIVTGEISCILDADHHPPADCFTRAWRWISQGYDVVQGRNVIRNYNENFLALNVAIEFELIYGISHAAKSFLTDSTIFGGSNGYWRTSVLKRIRFNPMRLTEDIDATLRSLLNGYRILHDRSIITTELAPVSLKAFWFQRKRWAHGWLEVSLIYQRRLWRTPYFNRWQKFYWTYLLYYCESCAIIALQSLPVVLSFWVVLQVIAREVHPYFFLAGSLSLFSGIYIILATAKVASRHYPLSYYVLHMLFLPFYMTFKNSITVVAMYDYLIGDHVWVVTPRDIKSQKRYRLEH